MKYKLFSGLLFLALLNFGFQNTYAQESCTDCHTEQMEYKTLHPVVEDCETCHQPDGGEHPMDAGMSLTETLPALCYMCHEEYTKSNIHYPAAEGECTSCHSPHGSENSAMLVEAPAQLCAVCHDTGIPETYTAHYPYAEGECSSCHDPHQSDNSTLLNSPMPTLCYECHENTAEGASSVHAVLEECTTCHSPHSSEQPKLLTEKMPDLCYMCHEKSNGKHIHSPVKNGKCVSCHTPHASAQVSLLAGTSQELCLNCHSRTYKTDSTMVVNIGRKIKDSKFIHAAIEMDGCATCHSGHNTGRPAMLKSNFPPGPYASAKAENFSLCFDCHDSAILEEDVNASGTNFRNDNQNLHYSHINGDKGRSCSMCHDVHASINQHLLRETVPFGNWEMNMNYKLFENGGSCMPGCHGELKYSFEL